MRRRIDNPSSRPTYPHPDGYALSFGQGLEWHLYAHQSAADFGGLLAALMGLSPHEVAGPRRPRIVLTRDAGFFDSARPTGNPDGFWGETLDLGGIVTAKLARGSRDAVLFLPHPPDRELDHVACAMSVFPIFDAALARGGLPLHGALVEKGGKASIISAAGGTGKSTCARRIPLPWRALGDDEVLIVAREDGAFFAHPFPTWSDLFFQRRESPRAWRTGFGVRLSGIYFLEQAALDRSAPLERQQAPMRITSGSLQAIQRFQHLLPSTKKRELYRRIFDNACLMVKRVPCHSLKATLTGSFWEEMG